MRNVYLLVLWVSVVLGGIEGGEECGGVLSSEAGLITTPGFPGPFPVPLHCRWILDSSAHMPEEDMAIVVYLTQLYVSTGLTFTEFDYYDPDSSFLVEPKLVHSVTESNVISVQWVWTKKNYFVIELNIDRLEGNHLRVLDDLLDVYGFNLTYEMRSAPGNPVRNNSCNVISCSLAGNCYASSDFTNYWCSCFPGFSGPDCERGPLCQPDTNICRNGATCRHVGMSALCHCSPGYTGPHCDVPILQSECDGEEDCSVQCRFDGTKENICNCDTSGVRVSPDRSRFELKIRLANVSTQRIKHPGRTLNHFIEKQLSKYLRTASLSKVEDLHVLNITGHDAGRVREAGNHLMERGRLGADMQLVGTQHSFTQQPALSLEGVRVNHKEPIIREGDQFILSCLAQGSSYMTFSWYKDGILINETRSTRSMWTRLLPQDARELYTALLGVEDVSILDEGHYTCHVADWGVQECKSIYIEVKQAPQVQISPMSATVQKGDNINLKCVSSNQREQDEVGYSWTRDNSLFPMAPGKEFWEDLKPGGTILRVYNIQKTTTYTCKAQTSAATQSQSVRIDVVNRTSIAICPAEYTDEVRWGDAGPGSTAISECPNRYLGVAKKQCLITEPGKAQWQRPDFSDCISIPLYKIIANFHELTRGFEVTSCERTISDLLLFLQERFQLYPGEGEPMVALLEDIFEYINKTSAFEVLMNVTPYFYETVSALLQFKNAIFHHDKVSNLQSLVSTWALQWGLYLNSTNGHLPYENLVVHIVSFRDETQNSYYFPMQSTRYPEWFNIKVALHVIGYNTSLAKQFPNRVSVVIYRNISNYLSPRSSQKMSDGSEMMYEIVSNLVSVTASGVLKNLHVEMELPIRGLRESWNVTCAVATALGDDWDFTSCNYSVKKLNKSQCVCQKLGVYTAMLTSHSAFNSFGKDKNFRPSSIVVMGCACCLLQCLLTLILLLIQCLHHSTCILFLKVQCCTSTAVSMTIFIYTSKNVVSQFSYSYISTLIEALIFIGISTHLSKLLIVYTEVVHLPNIRNLKFTVFGIVTGVTILTLLCSLLAHHLSGSALTSWWLPYDSTLFYVAVTCGALLTTLFTFLYCNLMHRLKLMLRVQNSKTSRAILRRIGLLKRTAILFISMLIMTISSILYVNSPMKMYQYFFSISCALLGLVIFLCYIIFSESTINILVLKKFKMDKSKEQNCDSDSDNNLFNFFTKQEAEMESDSAPPCIKNSINIPLADMISDKEQIVAKPKMVTFNGSTASGKGCMEKEDVDLEEYPNSPRKYARAENDVIPTYQYDLQEVPITVLHSTEISSSKVIEPHSDYVVPSEELLTTRVCVELEDKDPLANDKETPTLKCSVQVEPDSVKEVNDLKKTGSELCFVELKKKSDTSAPACDISDTNVVEDHDVLDRISHDLDYLLNRKPDIEVAPFQRHSQVKLSLTDKEKPNSSLKKS